MCLLCSPIFQAFQTYRNSATDDSGRRNFMRTGGLFTGILALDALTPVAAQSMAAPKRSGAGAADLIYSGGDIVTVSASLPQAEAVAVRKGVIVGVGRRTDVLKAWQGPKTRMVDLAGRTLIPGFIDAHSHMAQHETTWGLPNLNPPPVGGIRSIEDIVTVFKQYISDHKIPPGTLVLAGGYDESLMREGRHPTRFDLDRVSTEHPVIAMHTSGHLLAVNSRALAAVKYTRDTKDPAGGAIQRDANGEPTGVVEELAALPFLMLIKPHDMATQLKNFGEIQEYYLRHGVTTAQDGISMANDLALMREAANTGLLMIDLVAYPRWDQFNDVLEGKRTLAVDIHPLGSVGADVLGAPVSASAATISGKGRAQVGIYQKRLKIGGIKITGDGAPVAKTAFLTQPYLKPPQGMPADYKGYPSVTQDELDRWFDLAWRNNLQLLVHCNGDASADQMIRAARKAIARHGKKELRPVMIHAQFVRQDQLDDMKELGITPSFFSGHTYYWGDWHINETVGSARAFGMSPMASARKKGLRFTNHSDAPVVPIDHLMIIWTAVNRVSRSGVVVGPEERITALDALRAVTLDAAYQYFEEKRKGSIEVGKLADLVILDKNPLTVAPMAIKDIKVLETIKEGQTVWRA
jgi:predicted amidohydrolase YtcJ